MKTIVVATDYSYNANNTLDYAAALAAYTKSKLILFNAFQLPVHASNSLVSPTAIDELIEANSTRLNNIALEAGAKFGIAVESKTTFSTVTGALKEFALDVKADMVVMGMHSNNWGDKLFGNTTIAVIRTASFPVLIVPENAVFTGIEKILYAFDTNNLYVPTQLSLVKEFANEFAAEVEVMHVETRKRKAEGKPHAKNDRVIEAALTGVAHYYKDVEEEDVADGIENEIEESNADLLVMLPHKLSVWNSLFNLSTTRTMALRSQIPILVLPCTNSIHYN